MAETGNTTRTQLINLEGLSTFLDESKKIFEPTLPAGTDGQVLKLSGGKPSWEVSNEFDEIHAESIITESIQAKNAYTKFIYLDGDIPKYKIGDTGPGGGVVFYDAGKTITSSYLDSNGSEVKYTWRYLEVSPRLSITMPDGSTSLTIPWGVNWNSSSGWLWDASVVEGLKADIGTGRYNTTKAVNQLGTSFNSHYYSSPMTADKLTGPGNYAPCVCYNYRGGGFSDWYLPSIQELVKIYTNAALPKYISESNWLWSSSVGSSTGCWHLPFSVPYVAYNGRFDRGFVRAVRGFTS